MTDIPVFEYNEKFEIAGRGTVYYGPSPFDDKHRDMKWRGAQVIVDGKLRIIRGVETLMSFYGPRIGSLIGILLYSEEENSWVEASETRTISEPLTSVIKSG